jgi:hypothetical protein
VPTLEEIRYVYGCIRDEIDSKDGPDTIKAYYKFAAPQLERFWGDGSHMPEPMQYNLTGLGEMTTQGVFDNALDPIVNEIDIEYPWVGSSGLWKRALKQIAMCLYLVHVKNTQPTLLAQHLATQEPLPDPEF